MRAFLTVLDAITRVAAILAAVCVGITALGYVIEIASRTLFSSPLNGANDIGRYMLCGAVFLALPQVTRNQGHVAITLLPDALAPRAGRLYRRALLLLTAAVVLIVAWFCADVGMVQYRQGVLTAMANQIPRWWLTVVVVFGLVLSALHMILARPPVPGASAGHGEV